ncbi:hypothetical protein CDQ92_08030 [Sphingopyxis bauzanensis]|uniref:Outer membrane protein beta-barrel domain-containing protein n=3 Tax=Sphingopyxis bauzanensis TaxID=651663 RepID=A0A246JVG4_9SPHN|nr:hypothetical protein CDQ92_08030 [Sphingopyxis bauzanensis]
MIAAVCACSASMAFAQSPPEMTLDVSVGGGITSNPFLDSNGKTSGSATIALSPSVFVEDELGETRLRGDLRLTQYLQRYGSDIAGALEATTVRKLDERTQLEIGVSARTSRSALGNGLIFAPTPGEIPGPLVPPVSPILDTTIAGTRARTTSIGTNIGIAHELDELSGLNAGVELNGTYIGNDAGFDYRSASANLGYERKLSPRTTVTMGTQVGGVDYLGRRTGDSLIVSPRVGVQQQLSERMNLIADAGISFVRTAVVGGHSERVTFAGSLGLCDRGPNRSLCLSASRSAQPTALGGVSTVTTAALSYDARLSRVDRLALGARYGRTNEDGAGLPLVRVTDFVGASATYSRDISERIALTVTPSYAKLFDDLQPRRANYAIMFGLTMKFGKRR